ncbi:MAG: aminotransferase class IV [Bacteroidales bacterium]|jgi:branched-chain amino acid aminotransferase|nr:amino acid aminotransferase [Lentimicrobium sp.]
MICFINNSFVPYRDATLHISDVGLQRGFGIFDYFISVNGAIPFFDDYLNRFYLSAEKLNLKVPFDRGDLKKKIYHLLNENKLAITGVKLLLTGGFADDLYTPTDPNFLIINIPVPNYSDTYSDGIKLLLLDYVRYLPEVKTTFYLPALSLLPELKRIGALETLYHHKGIVYETTRANFFIIKNGVLITPSEGILKGITRKHVLKVARLQMKVEERIVKLDEIFDSDEIFITGTSKHILPVVNIDGKIIANGRPGTITNKLAQDFKAYYQDQIDKK